MNGPVVFWDLSHVPKDYRKGGHLPLVIRPETGSGSGYLSNSGTRSPKVSILNGERGEQSLKQNFPFWVDLCFK
ncbi:unnamed protein product, partial [Staurois parvus]